MMYVSLICLYYIFTYCHKYIFVFLFLITIMCVYTQTLGVCIRFIFYNVFLYVKNICLTSETVDHGGSRCHHGR